MDQVRSFIAIELPDELKRRLGQFETSLESGGRYRAKWVKPGSIHLTLKFLGNVAADRIAEIEEAISEAVRGIPPFSLEVEGPGAFPDLNRVQVVWIGISGAMDKLGRLQKRLESNLEPLGFAPEKRAFRPHLTVARMHNEASVEERREFGRHIADTGFDPVALPVKAVNLMKSQLTRAGGVYSRLHSAELTG
ncbi:MAG: RNA 2',3'-cyclic phosphodiesterase [Dehalococcoidales bacterium]